MDETVEKELSALKAYVVKLEAELSEYGHTHGWTDKARLLLRASPVSGTAAAEAGLRSPHTRLN